MPKRFLYLVPVATAFALPAIIFAQEPHQPAWVDLQDLHLDVIPRTD